MVFYKVIMANYITKEGLEKVQKELNELKTVKRREISDRLRKAIAFGDLSENFDYHDAREQQEFLERRIAELEDMAAGASVIARSSSKGQIGIGSQVILQEGKEKVVFTITGSQEANPLEGKLSAESPLGSALLNKKKGEAVEIETPSGKTAYKILEIS